MAQINIDKKIITTETEDDNNFDPVPIDDYMVIICNSDYKRNNKDTGMNLSLTYKIIEGPFKDRIIFENLSVEHNILKTQEIAQRTYNSIKLAIGVSEINDTAELHNKPLKIKVGIKNDQNGEPKNIVKKHFSLSDVPPPVKESGSSPKSKATNNLDPHVYNPETGEKWMPFQAKEKAACLKKLGLE
jgi:hypothetical protein